MRTPSSKIRSIIKHIFFMVADVAFVFAAYFCTLLFRFGGEVPQFYLNEIIACSPLIAAFYIASNTLFGLYTNYWSHAGINEMMFVGLSTVCATGISYVVGSVLGLFMLPASIYLASGLILLLLFAFLRMAYRIYKRFNKMMKRNSPDVVRAMVVGAGDTGTSIIRQLLDTPSVNILPVCIADDDPYKIGTSICGVRVVGNTKQLRAITKRYNVQQIVFAIPSATPETRKRILEESTATGCELKILPGVEALLSGIDYKNIRDVHIGDLLAREEVRLEMASIRGYIEGTTVLVTGGGGSIGSELCRQIAQFKPKKLIAFDIYENTAYELFVELKRNYGDTLDFEVVIGSVRDKKRLDEVFGKYKPDVVFHAAAHKHVPLMEESPVEAIKNNVDGTFNTAKAADIAGVKRFVLISTDKAVNPSNIMGATKYLCELIVQYMNQKSEHTDYVAVRFGNVLGSNGSVIPLFRQQIKAGGPVTVTDKDVTRYFMTIPEAAQLVMQAGSMAHQGEIFILDMGEPVRIDDFARTLIRLSGFEPDIDIKIEYTGLRPGEKMYEELLQDGETVNQSTFSGIMIAKTHPLTAEEIKTRVDYIRQKADCDPENIKKYIAEVVPTYTGKNDGYAEKKSRV